VKGESSGIAIEISSACPIALSLCLLTRCKSSRDVDAARNAIAEPTLPLPIIDSNRYHPSLNPIQYLLERNIFLSFL